jgi:hypothetical protein
MTLIKLPNLQMIATFFFAIFFVKTVTLVT